MATSSRHGWCGRSSGVAKCIVHDFGFMHRDHNFVCVCRQRCVSCWFRTHDMLRRASIGTALQRGRHLGVCVCLYVCLRTRDQVESELKGVCGEVLEQIDTALLPIASSAEAKVFFMKMKGDYCRCVRVIVGRLVVIPQWTRIVWKGVSIYDAHRSSRWWIPRYEGIALDDN